MKTFNQLAVFCLTLMGLSLVPRMASAQGVGGGGNHGGGFIFAIGCKEGQKAMFSERSSDGEHERAVWRTCHQGSYYDLSEYIYNPKSRCYQEGQTRQVLRGANGDDNKWLWFVCRKGEWKHLKNQDQQ